MHYRALVTFNKEHAKNSEEARIYAATKLTEEGFCNQEVRFSSAPADWFVIGGRWTGELTKLKLDQVKLKKFMEEFDKKYGFFTNKDNPREKRMEQAKELFAKYFPDFKGLNPIWRDTYAQEGFDDDAQIVDVQIYNELLKEHEGSYEDGEHFWDLDYDEVSNDFINKKWIVVVDYHN